MSLPQKALYSQHQGSGYICEEKNDIYQVCSPGTFELLGKTYTPGEMTDLAGFFKEPIEYIGNDGKEAIFYMGAGDATLFEQKHYFQWVLIVDHDRIFLIYGHGSGRDYNFRNGKWK